MERIQIKLHEVMGKHRIKQAELSSASGVRYATLNPIYHGKTVRVDLETLARLLRGLRELTGQPYTVADLLEYTETTPELSQDELLASSAADLRDHLQALEADTPPEELDAWTSAFTGKSA